MRVDFPQMIEHFKKSLSAFGTFSKKGSGENKPIEEDTFMYYPFVGLCMSLLWILFAAFLNLIRCRSPILLFLFPLIFTGFRPLKQFLWTATSFYQPDVPSRRHALFSHSFGINTALVMGILLLLFYSIFGKVYPLEGSDFWPFLFIPIISRTLCALASVLLPSLDQGWTPTKEGNSRNASAFLFGVLLVTLLLSFLFGGWLFFIAVLFTVVLFTFAFLFFFHQYGGISLEILGALLILSELSGFFICAYL